MWDFSAEHLFIISSVAVVLSKVSTLGVIVQTLCAWVDMTLCTGGQSVDTVPVTDYETLEWSQLPCYHAVCSQKESSFPVQLQLVAMETEGFFSHTH